MVDQYKQTKLECGPMSSVMAALPNIGGAPSVQRRKVWVTPTARVPCSKSQIPLHYLVADRSEAGRRPAASWNLAYHLARSFAKNPPVNDQCTNSI